MKYCNKCNVKVGNPVERCPLCYAYLERIDGNVEERSYPPVFQQAERYNLIKRIFVMLSFTVSVVCLTVNYFAPHHTWWSLIVVGNILYMWVAIGTAVRKRSKLGYNILIHVISLAGILVLIDRVSGQRGWALDYVVPFLFITATMSITVLTIVKRMDSNRFILYLFLTALIGFIPIILLAVGWVKVLWPSLASALYSGLSLVGMFVFADRSTKQELKKRFYL